MSNSHYSVMHDKCHRVDFWSIQVALYKCNISLLVFYVLKEESVADCVTETCSGREKLRQRRRKLTSGFLGKFVEKLKLMQWPKFTWTNAMIQKMIVLVQQRAGEKAFNTVHGENTISTLAAYHSSGLYWIWSNRQPKVELVFLLTPWILVKDFVLLALQKYHKDMNQCPLFFNLIAAVVFCQGGEPKEKIKNWGQEWHKEEREAQEEWTHASDNCCPGRGSSGSGCPCSSGLAPTGGGHLRSNNGLSYPLTSREIPACSCPCCPSSCTSVWTCPELCLCPHPDFSSSRQASSRYGSSSRSRCCFSASSLPRPCSSCGSCSYLRSSQGGDRLQRATKQGGPWPGLDWGSGSRWGRRHLFIARQKSWSRYECGEDATIDNWLC